MKYHLINRLYENKVTNKRSQLYFEVCEELDVLTLNPDFECPTPTGWFTDPFKETRTVEPKELDRITELNPVESTIDDLIEAICDALLSIWDTRKTQVFLHSSGYDSRVLSACVRELHRRHGDQWLGDILFLSNRWEAGTFREIMHLEGWSKDYYLVYDVGHESEHYDRVLDFDRFWYTNNAPMPMPGRFFSYLVEWAQEIGRLPKDDDLQIFNGHGPALSGIDREGVWTLDRNLKQKIKQILEAKSSSYYTPQCLNYPNNSHTNFVLAEEHVVNTALGYNTKGMIRKDILDVLCPEIADIYNLSINDCHAEIAKHILTRCEKEFTESYYAEITGEEWKAPKTAKVSKEWAVWSVASLCEHLHRQGIRIVNDYCS